MQLFYAPELDIETTTYSFDKEESKHIVKVLRKKEGDQLHITNGNGFLFHCEIRLATERKCLVDIIQYEQFSKRNFSIHLAVAPTKMNDRFEWFLEKATEIGIDEITPIICDHSERKIIKTERFHKIIVSAMKQSNQMFLPKLNEPISFKKFIQNPILGERFIAHCDDLYKTPLKDNFTLNSAYTLLIGPEGDFSKAEIELAIESMYQPVTLGQTRLRTETAAIVACHSFVYGNE